MAEVRAGAEAAANKATREREVANQALARRGEQLAAAEAEVGAAKERQVAAVAEHDLAAANQLLRLQQVCDIHDKYTAKRGDRTGGERFVGESFSRMG